MIRIVMILLYFFCSVSLCIFHHTTQVYGRKRADSATSSCHRLSLQKHYKNTSIYVSTKRRKKGEIFFFIFYVFLRSYPVDRMILQSKTSSLIQKLLLLGRRENMVEITKEREEAMSDRATEAVGVEMTQDCYLILRNRRWAIASDGPLLPLGGRAGFVWAVQRWRNILLSLLANM